jgi:uncharacterized protein
MDTIVSTRGDLRHKIWAMTPESTEEFLQKTFVVRVGTVDSEGFPYVVPQLFVYENGKVWLHQTSTKGHLRRNLEFNSKVCLEFDEHGEFFPYGATQCDTVVAYKSVIAFGSLQFVTCDEEKLAFFDKFMIKYAGASWGREEHSYPRMDPTAVYEVQLEKVTGKHQEADVTLKRWDGAEDKLGGPGTYGCPFHRAVLEAETQAFEMNGGDAKAV